MFWRRYAFIGVLMLVIGLVLGYRISGWSHHHHRNRVTAKRYPSADHNNRAAPVIAANRNQNQNQNQKQWDPFAEMQRITGH